MSRSSNDLPFGVDFGRPRWSCLAKPVTISLNLGPASPDEAAVKSLELPKVEFKILRYRKGTDLPKQQSFLNKERSPKPANYAQFMRQSRKLDFLCPFVGFPSTGICIMIDEGTVPTQMWSFQLLEVRTPPSPDRARDPQLNHFDWVHSADCFEESHRDSSVW